MSLCFGFICVCVTADQRRETNGTFSPPLSARSSESLPVDSCVSRSSLPHTVDSPLGAPSPKATEVIGGQSRCLCNNGNSIRNWRGVGRYGVSNPGLYFPESSRLAGGGIRRETRSAGWEEDREVPGPPRQSEEDVWKAGWSHHSKHGHRACF